MKTENTCEVSQQICSKTQNNSKTPYKNDLYNLNAIMELDTISLSLNILLSQMPTI